MIKKITIKNFKSIRELTFDFSNFTVIVGHNGAGKTNLLKAIQLVSQLAMGKKINEAFLEMDLVPGEIFHNKSIPKVSFSLDLEFAGRHSTYSLEIVKDINELGNSIFRISEESLYNGKPTPILQRKGDKVEIQADEGTAVSELVNSQLALSLFKKPQIIAEVQNFLSSIVVNNFSANQLRMFGAISKIENVSNMNFIETLYKLEKNNQDQYNIIKKQLQDIIPEIENLSIEPINGKYLNLKFKENNIIDPYSIFSASDGNLRALGILISIFSIPKPSIILIDEIESSMHPKRIKPLMALLQLFAEKEKNSVQVVITTHSPIVVDFVSNTNQLNYIYKKDAETNISKTRKNHEVIQKIEREIEEGTSLGDLYASGILEAMFLNPKDI